MNLLELAKFLVKAKKNAYAGDGKEISSQRQGFIELEYKEGDWYYRDSFTGFFQAPGQEVVYYKEKPVWAMAYSGGMRKEFHGNIDFTQKTFGFLIKCLSQVKEDEPFRGPRNYSEGDFSYQMIVNGDITDFSGKEKIFYQEKEVFRQHFIGGTVIQK